MGSPGGIVDLDDLLDDALEGFAGLDDGGSGDGAGQGAGQVGDVDGVEGSRTGSSEVLGDGFVGAGGVGVRGGSLALPRQKRRGGGARRPEAPPGGDEPAVELARAAQGRMAEAERLVAEFERTQMFEGGAIREGAPGMDDAAAAMRARAGDGAGAGQDSIAASLSQLNSGLEGMEGHAGGGEVPEDAGVLPGLGAGDDTLGMDEAMLEELAKQFGNLSGEGGDGFEGMMDAMMMQLMSKDVLYGPMKHMEARFPEWLAENPEGLDDAGLAPYRRQYACVQRLVAAYDAEPDNFDKVVELMQELQDAGQPPEVIVRELHPEGGPNLSALGLGPGGGMPPGECTLM